MTPEEFYQLAAEIARLNQVDEEAAAAWLVLIGDTPEFLDGGRVMIPDDTGQSIVWPPEDF